MPRELGDAISVAGVQVRVDVTSARASKTDSARAFSEGGLAETMFFAKRAQRDEYGLGRGIVVQGAGSWAALN